MSPAHLSSVGIVAYLGLFALVGVAFLFVTLLFGRLVRPANPQPEKGDVYECGEPAIGTSFIQFDLRFYVVALLFIIFDVEVAFFFPWATVFGKATHLADPRLAVVQSDASGTLELTDNARLLHRELGVSDPALPASRPGAAVRRRPRRSDRGARQLAWIAIADIGVFFAVLLVGFAYVWYRGDLDWVRAVVRRREEAAPAEQ